MSSQATPTTSQGSYSMVEAAEEPSTHYPYKPLDTTIDSIRLVVLHPQRVGESIPIVRCELIHTTFQKKPNYEALSYTWSNPTPTNNILLNDISVPVRENLYMALRNLRTNEDRLLWADAICIDQNNLEERTYQVGLMDYIYTRAESVLIWLGKGLSGWDENAVRLSKPWQQIAVEWVCSNEYWTRLWVIQEIGLARKLKVCTSTGSTDWAIFLLNFRWLTSSKLTRPTYWRGSDGEWKNFEDVVDKGVLLMCKLDAKRKGRHRNSNRLETLLEDFQHAQCTESRDKIYGFLGLAHDCQDGSIEADYNKPLFDLYSDVIRFFCRRRLLRNSATNEFDRAMRVVKFTQLVQKQLRSHIYPFVNTPSQELMHVQARGAIAGQIIHLGPTYNEIISSNNANKKWRLSFEDCYSLPQDIQRLREANDAYSGTLLGMRTDDIQKFCCIHPRKSYSRGICTLKKWEGDERKWENQDPDREVWEVGRDLEDHPTLDLHLDDSSEPRMFLGSNFLIGLAPCEAIEGDIMCQFWHTDVVALLRKEKDSEIYRVIGRLHLCTGSLDGVEPVYLAWNDPPKGANVIVIQMDLNTLSFLTC